MKKEKIELNMEYERETKNTYRFAAQQGDMPPAVRTLYVEKWAIPSGIKKILLTIEVIG